MKDQDNNNHSKPLFFFILIIMLIMFSDGIMAFIAPQMIEYVVKNTLIFGLIISVSSMAGLAFDVIAGEIFPDKNFTFFAKMTILMAFLFPLIMFFSDSLLVMLIISMIIWGIYYEGINYTKFSFVDHFIKKINYVNVWSIITIVSALSYFLGPVYMSYNLKFGYRLNLFFPMLLILISYIIFIYAKHKKIFSERNHQVLLEKKNLNIVSEIKIWHIFYKRLNLFWILTLVITATDVFMWTIGILYSRELAQSHPLGLFMLPVFTLPSIFFSVLANRFSDKYGKKKLVILTSMFIGFFFLAISFSTNVLTILLLTFFIGICFSIAVPARMATYEEFIGRVIHFKNDLIGFEQAATSLSYIIFPIIFGLISHYYGFNITIFVLGTATLITSVLASIFLPKKINMPQKELSEKWNS